MLTPRSWSTIRVGLVLAGCVACASPEEDPLGPPSYLSSNGNAGTSSAGDGSTAASGGAAVSTGGGSGGTGADTGGANVGGATGAAGNAGAGASAANAGAGGASVSCSTAPIPTKDRWHIKASSSSSANPITHINDDILTNRWSSGKSQAGDEWIELDFGATATISKATLVQGTSTNDFPRGYEVRLSDTSMNAGPPLLRGSGAASQDTVLLFPPFSAGRYLLIKQTGTATKYWSAAEIQLECAN